MVALVARALITTSPAAICRYAPPFARPAYGPSATTPLLTGSSQRNVKNVGMPTNGVTFGRVTKYGTGIAASSSSWFHKKFVIPLCRSPMSVPSGTNTTEMSNVRSGPPLSVSKSMSPKHDINM
jgi:hypothetical protein